MKSVSELKDYIGSNAPLIQVVSHEWEVVEGLIDSALENIGGKNGGVRQHFKWREVTGLQLFENGEQVEDLSDDLRAELAVANNPVQVLKWYVGEWKNGKRHGQGRVTWKNGVKYVGEWKDGGKNTNDIITYDVEVIWIGEFRNDQPWNVTSYDKDGNIVGKYVNGKHNPFY